MDILTKCSLHGRTVEDSVAHHYILQGYEIAFFMIFDGVIGTL